MLTFEEFMKKKKIDLAAMQRGEPSLFGEFQTHFNQMGEKSFDHTKKYWFNKLRRQYQLSPEIVVEKVHIENKLAEQTIINTITSPELVNSPRKDEPDTSQQPRVGFTPKFRAANTSKPAENPEQPKTEEKASTSLEEQATKPRVGFTPKFRAANAPKPAEDTQQPKAEETSASNEEQPVKPKVGFTPKFRAANAPKPADDAEQPKTENTTSPPVEEKPAPTKLGFTPKFRTANAPKPADDTEQFKAAEEATTSIEETTFEKISSEEKPAASKLGFTPKFSAANAPKPVEDPQQPIPPAEDDKKSTEENEGEKAAKPAYKPRFSMKNLPPKPPQE